MLGVETNEVCRFAHLRVGLARGLAGVARHDRNRPRTTVLDLERHLIQDLLARFERPGTPRVAPVLCECDGLVNVVNVRDRVAIPRLAVRTRVETELDLLRLVGQSLALGPDSPLNDLAHVTHGLGDVSRVDRVGGVAVSDVDEAWTRSGGGMVTP